MSGSKSFDYLFTVRDSGNYLIPAINLSYFDPSAQNIKPSTRNRWSCRLRRRLSGRGRLRRPRRQPVRQRTTSPEGLCGVCWK